MSDRHPSAQPGFIWQFPAAVDHVQDGDSVISHVMWAPGQEGHGENVRIEGINAIELNKPYGAEAKAYLANLLPPGTKYSLVTRKREKYGRSMGRIIRLEDGLDVGETMLLAKASDGVTPLAVPYSP